MSNTRIEAMAKAYSFEACGEVNPSSIKDTIEVIETAELELNGTCEGIFNINGDTDYIRIDGVDYLYNWDYKNEKWVFENLSSAVEKAKAFMCKIGRLREELQDVLNELGTVSDYDLRFPATYRTLDALATAIKEFEDYDTTVFKRLGENS